MKLLPPQAGFTLLEVLVAMAVLAIAMGAIIGAATQSIQTSAALRDQTFAGWVALNQVNVLLLDPEPWPEDGSRRGEAELAQRVWRWEARFEATDIPDLRLVRVTVRADADGPALNTLIAFKGQSPTDSSANPSLPP
ncbi:MAG: type II secretion system protein GspI [Candidatus Competibacteraceae bacterium]|nr:MAG: type II secretion system protein GspI [Candidatus Competibacteraceae bacterium]